MYSHFDLHSGWKKAKIFSYLAAWVEKRCFRKHYIARNNLSEIILFQNIFERDKG
jgi:hypothetical protein